MSTSKVWSFYTTLRDNIVGYINCFDKLNYLTFLKANRDADLKTHYDAFLLKLGMQRGLLG